MASIAAEPDWVVRMNAAASDARDAAARQAASEPLPPIAGVFFGGFVLAFFAIGIVGVAAPAWAARRWHGGWRLAALAPGAYMAFVILRIAVGTALDPTSHNLWPFEILIAGALSAIAIGALGLARRFAGVGR